MRQSSASLIGFIGALLLAVAPARAQDARLVKDIHAGSLGSAPARLTLVAGTLFFVADSGLIGKELYQSDGSPVGTTLVKDIYPGNSYTNSDPDNLTGIGSVLYFVASNGVTGRDLWKSDGTSVGTVLLKDFTGTPDGLMAFGNTLYFAANGGDGQELWKSDGSTAGTVQVKDISPGTLSGSPESITPVGGRVFFSATDGAATGRELWKSDGTGAGTILVKDIQAGGYPFSSNPSNLLAVGNVLFFTADDGLHGRELWTSDGTAAGTAMVLDIPGYSMGSSPSGLVNVAGTVFFAAAEMTHGRELWKSDGTPAGTELVMDIYPGLGNAINWSDPPDLTVVNNRVFFTANDGVNGRELWISDGTLGGTFLVRDIRPGTCTSTPCSSAPANLRDVGGILYFTADDGLNGRELWQSDGTASGTVLVQDIAPGAAASNPADITSLATRQGTYTFFTANDGNTGMELWLIPPAPTPPTAFYTVTPCRLVDTRDAPAPLGGPALVAWTDRSFVLVLARPECNIPLTASAVSLNIAVTQPAGAGNLRVLPTGGLMSTVSAINYAAGQTRANNAVVALGYGGAVTVRPSQSTGTTHFILDVNGYFE